jgi:hypothetical protein
MAVKQFEISLSLKNSLERRGRLDDYIRSHMFEHDMDREKTYSITEDEDRRVVMVTQHDESQDKQEDEFDIPF